MSPCASLREPPLVDHSHVSPWFVLLPHGIDDCENASDCASAGFCHPTEEVMFTPSLEIDRSSHLLRCFSRHRAQRSGHFTYDRFGVGYAVSPRDPARFVIRKPCCAGCIFPDERLQWQIDSNCLHRLHQRRAAAGVAENDELSRRQFQPSFRRACGMIDSGEDLHALEANLCFQSLHRLLWTEVAPDAR